MTWFRCWIVVLSGVLSIGGLLPGQEPAASNPVPPNVHEFFLDFARAKGTQTNGKTPAIVAGSVEPASRPERLVLTTPGRSKLTWRFGLPAIPTTAVLELEHLSSSSRARFGGTSVISLELNKGSVVEQWDVGSHGLARDRIHVSKFLRPGWNRLQLRFVGGTTRYWLRAIRLRCTFSPETRLGGLNSRVERRPPEGRSDHAVVVRRGVYEDPDWQRVVDHLVQKHRAVVVLYPVTVAEARVELAESSPRYVAFVSPPEEIGRAFVLAVHRLTRALDPDPYGDALWGIVTGYSAADALALVRESRPLSVRRVLAGCGVDLESFREGEWYSECEQGQREVREPGGKPRKEKAPDDATEALVQALNRTAPDFVCTSGHATDRDWQIGYRFKSGQFRCARGQLFGLDTQNRRFPVHSPNPKVYGPAGNCLMGLVRDRDAMALAWMHSAGVRQMIGYTVSTWYGYAGHGTLKYFVNLQGQHTLAEAFFLNNQALLDRLEKESPGALAKKLEDYDIESDASRALGRIAGELEIRSRDGLGLMWDRDTLAFYGDPAWQARVDAVRTPDYEARLTHEPGADGRVLFKLTVQVNRDGRLCCPPAALLPFRVQDVVVQSRVDPAPLVTDDFVLWPRTEPLKKGDRIVISFTARRKDES